MEPSDEVSFEVALRHPAETPDVITRTLELTPKVSWAAGTRAGAHVHGASYWIGTIGSSGDQTFDELLTSVVSLLTRKEAFCTEFIRTGGEIDIILNGHIAEPELGKSGADFKPKVFETILYPKFLNALTIFPVALKIQMWA